MERAEVTTFSVKEGYAYNIPPAGTVGHRAANWDVDHWLQAVSIKVVSAGDDCFVRLADMATGALFAECPVPNDAPLITAVEPVVDSSRYFVLRVVDRASKRHAFLGIGFRERTQASDFGAALHDHVQVLRRQKEAEERRAAYEAGPAESAPGAFAPQADLALKPGETMRLRLSGKELGGGSKLLSSLQTAVVLKPGAVLGPPPAHSLHRTSPGSSGAAAPGSQERTAAVPAQPKLMPRVSADGLPAEGAQPGATSAQREGQLSSTAVAQAARTLDEQPADGAQPGPASAQREGQVASQAPAQALPRQEPAGDLQPPGSSQPGAASEQREGHLSAQALAEAAQTPELSSVQPPAGKLQEEDWGEFQ